MAPYGGLAAPYRDLAAPYRGLAAPYGGLAAHYRGLAAPYGVFQQLTWSCGTFQGHAVPNEVFWHLMCFLRRLMGVLWRITGVLQRLMEPYGA